LKAKNSKLINQRIIHGSLHVFITSTFLWYLFSINIFAVPEVYYFIFFFTGVSLLFLEFKKYFFKYRYIFYILLLFVISGVINDLLINDHTIYWWLRLAASIGIGFSLIKYNKSRIPFILIYVFFLFTLYYSLAGYNMSSMLPERSWNHISVISISLFIIYYITFEVNNNYTKYKVEIFITSIVVTLTCVLATGRGGILSSLILLFGSSLFFLKQFNRRTRWGLIISFTLVVIFIAWPLFFDFISEHTKFGDDGLDSSRELHWQRFLFFLTQGDLLKNILFGMPYHDYMILFNWHSLHNSYTWLNFHYGFGVFVIIFMIIYSLYYSYKNRKYLLLFCIMSISFRSLTDAIILQNEFVFPIIVALFVLTYFQKNKFIY